MNILFWADGFWPRIGGTETQGFQFCKEMQRRGHRCFVVAQRDSKLWMEEEIYKKISIRRFDFDAALKKNDLKVIRSFSEYLEEILNQIDLVYLNTLGNGSAFLFLILRKLISQPIVATIHAPYYGDHPPPLVLGICEGLDFICSPSKWGYGEMEKILSDRCRKKLRYIPYGLTLPKTLASPLSFSPPVILFLGRLSSEKGFDLGLKAFSFLKREGSNAELLIVGEGNERPFLEHLTDGLGLRDSVRFMGALLRDREAVFETINRSTFVVMPSIFEAFGLTALESMRMGRPVIASRVGGLGEIITDGKTGLLFPPQDPLALYNAMRHLLDHPKLTKEMGQNAKRFAADHYLLEESVDDYERLFRQALEDSKCCL